MRTHLTFTLLYCAVGSLTINFAVAVEVTDEIRTFAMLAQLGGRTMRDESLPERPVFYIHFTESNHHFNVSHFHLLKSFPDLTSLDLKYTVISDALPEEFAQLEVLGEFKKLKSLSLMNTGITDRGMKIVGRITSLTDLNLYNTRITDQGLKELRLLKRLTKLNLASTDISEDGLKELVELEKLTDLMLNSPSITDRGLKSLSHCKSLKKLALYNTQTTSEGVHELKASLPGLKVDRPLPFYDILDLRRE